ncbi:hypothetical protein CTAYLR_002453 [Chrysophaeum taylorii]|uniref:uracil phosphoribosyltransferase n=1 Tax=Chrysophaeum taylorii TaxID=2483200 RepID=A0AAD7ULX5_9STRA|nr:hypothetical protein CTAYLR_002453 [Chrysophaeum taylorii]
MQTAVEQNPRASLFSTRGTTALLRIVRDKRTPQKEYASAADRLCHLLAEEALASIVSDDEVSDVETPCGRARMSGGRHVDTSNMCVVDIMRSGAILMEAVRKLAPDIKTAKILIQRDEATALPCLMYSKLPPNIADYHHVLLCDPMLATGGSACAAIDVLKLAGVAPEKILFANVISCPEGLRRVAEHAQEVRILTTAVDDHLDERKFIIPGLGDFGDRYYGTSGYQEGHWGELCVP